MGIKNEIDALRRRMLEECQRDVDAMGEVARVFMSIEEARSSGYAHLARVFGGGGATSAEPLHAHTPPSLAEARPQSPWSHQDPYAPPAVPAHPDASRRIPTDPDAYDKAVREAYGDLDGFSADFSDAQAREIAGRFASGGRQ